MVRPIRKDILDQLPKEESAFVVMPHSAIVSTRTIEGSSNGINSVTVTLDVARRLSGIEKIQAHQAIHMMEQASGPESPLYTQGEAILESLGGKTVQQYMAKGNGHHGQVAIKIEDKSYGYRVQGGAIGINDGDGDSSRHLAGITNNPSEIDRAITALNIRQAQEQATTRIVEKPTNLLEVILLRTGLRKPTVTSVVDLNKKKEIEEDLAYNRIQHEHQLKQDLLLFQATQRGGVLPEEYLSHSFQTEVFEALAVETEEYIARLDASSSGVEHVSTGDGYTEIRDESWARAHGFDC